MKFTTANLITVKKTPGGGIREGEALPILKIGRDGDPDCYGVVSPCDGKMYFLHEDEVELATNAERLRSMDDARLGLLLFQIVSTGSPDVNGKKLKTIDDVKAWLKEPVPVVDAAN